MSTLPLLMALRVQGVASADRVAVACDLDVDATRTELAALVTSGAATQRSGRVAGFTLTEAGTSSLTELVAKEALRDDDGLREGYDRFCVLNERVLRVCSDWQVRRHRGIEETNDHSDPDYDDEVLKNLESLHDRIRPVISGLVSCSSRYAPYGSRLASCVDRVLGGDRSAFTAPMAESVHTVWFELHQDLLLTLGLEREV